MSKRSRFTEEQIIRALKEADAGAKVDEVCRRLGVAQTTFYRWKSKFDGMEVSDARRLRQEPFVSVRPGGSRGAAVRWRQAPSRCRSAGARARAARHPE